VFIQKCKHRCKSLPRLCHIFFQTKPSETEILPISKSMPTHLYRNCMLKDIFSFFKRPRRLQPQVKACSITSKSASVWLCRKTSTILHKRQMGVSNSVLPSV